MGGLSSSKSIKPGGTGVQSCSSRSQPTETANLGLSSMPARRAFRSSIREFAKCCFTGCSVPKHALVRRITPTEPPRKKCFVS